MRIDEALQQIDTISAVANRATVYRGFRAFPTALTGLLGILAACLQEVWSARYLDRSLAFVDLWVVVAVISLTLVMVDVFLGHLREPTVRSRRMTLQVLSRLAPAIVVGGALALIFTVRAREVIWMLPGLWSLLLGLGIFAASISLPRRLQQVGIWYIGWGLILLVIGKGDLALHPLTMAIPFGLGQLLTAWLMHHEARIQRGTA